MTAPISVRTRFAPSPTGAMHLGNARAAIFNWLYARRHNGAFVLRLEDTDEARNVSGGEAAIMEALAWLGVPPDEGPGVGGPYGPYRQSERSARHQQLAQTLLEAGHAFRCFCTSDEIEARRQEALERGVAGNRDTRCRNLTSGEIAGLEADGRTPALRLRVDDAAVSYHDRIKGKLTVAGADIGDFVILRADGRPTYNFAVSADDTDMAITHVIRGVGHLSNTPKQVLVYRALGVPPPTFVHIPTVLAPGGGKLSKRHGAESVLSYRDRGYHRDAVLNHLSLLSWSPRDGREVLSRADLVRAIDLEGLGSTDGQVDEGKLAWLSGQHFRLHTPDELAAVWGKLEEVVALELDPVDLRRAADVLAERIQILTEVGQELASVFGEPNLGDPEVLGSLQGPRASEAIGLAHSRWRESTWAPADLGKDLRQAGKKARLGGRKLFVPVRVSLTGREHGPDIGATAYALGRTRVLGRLSKALNALCAIDS